MSSLVLSTLSKYLYFQLLGDIQRHAAEQLRVLANMANNKSQETSQQNAVQILDRRIIIIDILIIYHQNKFVELINLYLSCT